MEGGGQGKDSKAALRQGMDLFLREIKDACRARKWHWKLICCGGRTEAFRGFRRAHANGEGGVVVLLVDAEAPVDALTPTDHLTARDHWDFAGADDNVVHLMVQTLEAWIVSDGETLRSYYGQGFQANALPRRSDLEKEDKEDIASALNRATRQTQKGKYHKIRHASDLLTRINPTIVRQRCRHCARLFETLLYLIGPAD